MTSKHASINFLPICGSPIATAEEFPSFSVSTTSEENDAPPTPSFPVSPPA